MLNVVDFTFTRRLMLVVVAFSQTSLTEHTFESPALPLSSITAAMNKSVTQPSADPLDKVSMIPYEFFPLNACNTCFFL